MQNHPRLKVDSVRCPEILPYQLVRDGDMWYHTVQLPQDTVEGIYDSMRDRGVQCPEDGRVILTKEISGARQFHTKQEAITSLRAFVNVREDSSGSSTVSKKAPTASSTPDAPAKRQKTFNLYIEKDDDLSFWSIVVTIQG
ncbi:hypothetical protein H2200_007544 [Cladophialophora chaetospira]|uniref:Uncharacterized protein n=1 Tax=Cladophialophora chaetospira TaxID=386627 RepID=A0AA38X843_9EURO|nr:hypothetical protein H2200_007544 [Cladophialophora chaetospira]